MKRCGELSEAAKKKIEEKAGIDVDAELEKLKNAQQAKGAATKAAEVASTAQEQLEAKEIAAENLRNKLQK